MNNIVRNSFWWIGLLILQLILLFYFRPTIVYSPYIYLLLLFRIPYSFSKIGTLFIAFATGLLIDIFLNSWGVHAFAAVLITFIYPSLASFFMEQSITDEVEFSQKSMGGFRYWFCLFLLLLLYHIIVLLVWNFSFNLLLHNLLKALISSTIAFIVTMLLFVLFNKKREEENV